MADDCPRLSPLRICLTKERHIHFELETTLKSAFDVQRTVKIYVMLKTILYALTQARNLWTKYSEHG
jgi:hypothetical protein